MSAPIERNVVRVAVAQLAFHPAYVADKRSVLEDPVFAGGSQPALVHPDIPSTSREHMRVLRTRVRQAYVSQVTKRVGAILDACAKWGVRVVVFPEYSVPWQALVGIAAHTKNLVVVAGTHTVEVATLEAGAYATAGAPADVIARTRPGEAVSPVFIDGVLVALQPKLAPAQGETLVAGDRWKPIPLPSDIPGPMGVLICLDALFSRSTGWSEFVSKEIEHARFLVVPSVTPRGSLAEFTAKGVEEARRYKRPVLYANGSDDPFVNKPAGGSTIFVDGGNSADFPQGTGVLRAGEEGVVVADIDLGNVGPGHSTAYDATPTIKPVALASFVYRATRGDDSYARLLSEIDSAGDQPAKLVAAVRGRRQGLDEAAIRGPSHRRNRINSLLDGLDHVAVGEDILQATREIVLPSDVLPLEALQAALAQGSLECVRSLLDREDARATYAAIESRLSPAIARLARSDYTQGALEVLDAIVSQVKGEETRSYLVTTVSELNDHDTKPAREAFENGQYSEAEAHYRKLVGRVDETLLREAQSIDLQRQRARYSLGLAASLLNQQNSDEGRRLLEVVDPAALSEENKCNLAMALAQVGNVASAEKLVEYLDVTQPLGREAADVVALFAGKPIQESTSAHVLTLSAQVELTRGNAAAAARDASRALELGGGFLTQALAFIALVKAIHDTLLDRATVPVPVEGRATLLDALERHSSMDVSRLPSALRCTLLHAQMMNAIVVEDDERQIEASAKLRADCGGEDGAKDDLVERLALRGDLDAARMALPWGSHAWLPALQWVGILGRIDNPRAADEAASLAVTYPGRAAIEYLAAMVLARAGRLAESLAHAQNAFELVPGRGQRLLLAQRLVGLSKWSEAWTILEPPILWTSPKYRWLRARVAEEVQPTQKLGLWREYLDVAPTHSEARTHLATLLFMAGQHDAAAREALAAVIDPGNERLSWDRLAAAARLIRAVPTPETKTHIRRIAGLLRERFPGNAQAEAARLTLLLETGDEPLGADFALLESAGLVQSFPSDRMIEILTERHAHLRTAIDATEKFYQAGKVSFETLADLTGLSPSLLLLNFYDRSRTDGPLLITPPAEGGPLLSVGESFIASELELLLLGQIGLLDDFLNASQEVVVFDDLAERLHSLWLTPPREVSDLPKVERLVALISDPRHFDLVENGVVPAPRVLIEHLRDERHLSMEAAEHVLSRLAPETDVSLVTDEWVMSPHVLRLLFDEGVLEEVTRSAGRLRLLLETARELRSEQEYGDRARRSVDLARGVHESLGAAFTRGRVRYIPRPTSLELPPLRPDSQGLEVVFRTPLARALSFRQSLVAYPSHLWICADFFEAQPVSDPDLVSRLLWPNAGAWQELSRLARSVEHRRVSFTNVVRRIASPTTRHAHLLTLAEIGFVDALDGEVIVGLWADFADLDRGRPKRVFDRATRLAQNPSSGHADHARMTLARGFAEGIGLAFAVGAGSEVRAPIRDPGALVRALLAKAEKIDAPIHGTSLTLTLLFTVLRLLERPSLAFVENDQGTFDLDQKSPAGRTLKALAEWAGPTGRRRAALSRVFQEVWLTLDGVHAAGPQPAQHAALSMGMELRHENSGSLDLTAVDVATVAILSANWEARPLSGTGLVLTETLSGKSLDISAEDALVRGAELLGVPNRMALDRDALVYELEFPGTQARIQVVAPPEALLLRAEAVVAGGVARGLAFTQGLLDGRLYRALLELGNAPSDFATRRRYAQIAASAPWRAVRADPGILLQWAARRPESGVGRPSDISELRAVLSEPDELLHADKEIAEILIERVMTGLWSAYPHRFELFLQARLIPGGLPLASIGSLLEAHDRNDHVRAALHRLKSPHDQSAAALAADIAFLRLALRKFPAVEDEHGRIDLAEEVPSLFADVLLACRNAPPVHTLAAHEGGLLRMIASVVSGLAGPMSMPFRDGLWLTYRLFQWFCAQLDGLEAGIRQDAIRALVPHLPPAGAPAVDVLHPGWFSRDGFDHRLASVLVALHGAEELALHSGEPAVDKALELVSLQRIESLVMQIADTPPTESELLAGALGSTLGWKFPVCVSELAVILLTRSRSEAILSLSAQTRGRLLGAIPRSAAAFEGRFGYLSLSVVPALLEHAAALSDVEQVVVEQLLEAWADVPQAQWLVALGNCRLYSAGRSNLRVRCRELINDNASAEWAVSAFGFYLEGIVASGDADIGTPAREILERAAADGHDIVPFAAGVARLAVRAEGAASGASRQLLLELAKEEPYRDDPRMGEICSFVGIPWRAK